MAGAGLEGWSRVSTVVLYARIVHVIAHGAAVRRRWAQGEWRSSASVAPSPRRLRLSPPITGTQVSGCGHAPSILGAGCLARLQLQGQVCYLDAVYTMQCGSAVDEQGGGRAAESNGQGQWAAGRAPVWDVIGGCALAGPVCDSQPQVPGLAMRCCVSLWATIAGPLRITRRRSVFWSGCPAVDHHHHTTALYTPAFTKPTTLPPPLSLLPTATATATLTTLTTLTTPPPRPRPHRRH